MAAAALTVVCVGVQSRSLMVEKAATLLGEGRNIASLKTVLQQPRHGRSQTCQRLACRGKASSMGRKLSTGIRTRSCRRAFIRVPIRRIEVSSPLVSFSINGTLSQSSSMPTRRFRLRADELVDVGIAAIIEPGAAWQFKDYVELSPVCGKTGRVGLRLCMIQSPRAGRQSILGLTGGDWKLPWGALLLTW